MSRTSLQHNTNDKEIDYLFEDPLIRNQQVCIVSFVGPNKNQKCKINAFKVRGAFENQDEAKKKMAKLHKMDPNFDMFLAPVGLWCPFNPNPDLIEDQKYGNDELNELMKGYHENKLKTDEHFNDRKRQMIEDAMREGTKEGQKDLSEIKEHPIAVKQRMCDLTEQLEESKKRISKIEESIKNTNAKLDNDYTKEELELADKEFADFKKRISEAESKDAISEIQEELRIKYTDYEKLHNRNPEEESQENSKEFKELTDKDPWLKSKE